MALARRQFWGQIIYEKVGDGCFNGLWNNNDRTNHGRILNEITRKSDGQRKTIEGTYISSWIETTNDPVNAKLIITRINRTEYSFIWNDFDSNVPLFQGVGMEIGLNNIAVTFWYADTPTLRLTT